MASPLGGKLKEGYLVKSPDSHKHLQQIKKWQKKWFRAHDNGDLHYYDSEKSSKPSGVIPLLQLYRIFDAKTSGVPLSYCVGIEGAGGSYLHYLKAETTEIYNAWLRVFRGFAEVVEVPYLDPDGSPSTSSRSTSPSTSRHGTLSSETPLAQERERLRVGSTASVQSRHFTVTTRARFGRKEGWLAKTGSNNTGWKNRYFILTNGKLLYYKSEKADTPLGTVDLFDSTGITKAPGKKGFGFMLEVPGRLYNISTESEVEQNDWILAINQTLAVLAEHKESPLTRSGSTSSTVSNASLGSRELLSEPPSGSLTSTARGDGLGSKRVQTLSSSTGDIESAVSHRESSLSASSGGRKEDSVVQLLEAEVDVLRGKVSHMESEIQTSRSTIGQLQDQLSEGRRQSVDEARVLREETENLATQLEQVEKSKEELETVNDSLRTQLEEYTDRVQELEEEQLAQRHDLDEANISTATAEEEVKVYHQELTDAQHKLQEIEEVARQLELALNSKDGDPQTPIYARMLMDSFSSGSKSSHGHGSSQEGAQPSPDSSPTLRRLREMRELQQSLQAVEKERDSLRARVKESEAAGSAGVDLEASMSGEKLKWQMEMANLRKEYETRMEQEQEGTSKERTSLETKVASLERAYATLQESSRTACSELEQNLSEAKQRISELEEEVSSEQERVGQLQVEKEKVLADLIAIRKINSSIEKRISEADIDPRTASPVVTANSPVVSIRESPDLQQRLLEAEGNTQELRTLLVETQRERDELKAQLDKLLSGAHNGIPEPDLDLLDTSRFGFGAKTTATTGTGHRAAAAPAERSRTASNAASMLQHASQNGALASNDAAPPKPRRPPKELVSRYQSQVQQPLPRPQQQQHRTRSGSFLQSIFSGLN